MNTKNLYHNALFSFFIFIILISKDISVSFLHLIPERGPTNRLISWLVVLPISIVGIILSIRIVRHHLRYWLDKRVVLINWTLLLSLPILLYVMYYVILFIVSLFMLINYSA